MKKVSPSIFMFMLSCCCSRESGGPDSGLQVADGASWAERNVELEPKQSSHPVSILSGRGFIPPNDLRFGSDDSATVDSGEMETLQLWGDGLSDLMAPEPKLTYRMVQFPPLGTHFKEYEIRVWVNEPTRFRGLLRLWGAEKLDGAEMYVWNNASNLAGSDDRLPFRCGKDFEIDLRAGGVVAGRVDPNEYDFPHELWSVLRNREMETDVPCCSGNFHSTSLFVERASGHEYELFQLPTQETGNTSSKRKLFLAVVAKFEDACGGFRLDK